MPSLVIVMAVADSARQNIFIAALTLGDKDLRESLIRAAARLRGGVYVVSALDSKGLQEAFNEYDDNPDIDAQLKHRNFRELTRYGITCAVTGACTRSSRSRTTGSPWCPALS